MEYGAHVVHCPESNLKLASGHCPVEALIHRGVNVALGTDGAASNNDLNMIGEIHTCALLAKGIAGAADAVPATQALRMATISGARALGLENDIGSLSPGKAADVVALNLSGVEAQPMYHPISQIVYAGSRDQVTDVWIAGRHVLKERTLLTLDEASVLKKAREWQSRIAGQ
jgi:5-methylthioadenosine/S-adenosylhomocysteine deaminase